jgi:hypothetical protein
MKKERPGHDDGDCPDFNPEIEQIYLHARYMAENEGRIEKNGRKRELATI